MVATIVVGLAFAMILLFAVKKVYSDAKNQKCSCSSACSPQTKCSLKE
ncbi:Virus attachment protein p12 family protein [Mesobacillus persicus]|uniref:Virus attachment protein p12 family protein n=1 Tax=Mesobacillus persicus TaxID=930146 RepID=A0A1H8G314_9BACI|nr:FeoB-associated Cys-rich membrane protein [Mesobacillus persicus]SEN37887.1 Virus attachment protein p12 family protein [Mesobacillus persicus]